MSADYHTNCPKCNGNLFWVTEYIGIEWDTLKIDGYAKGECDECRYTAIIEIKESKGSET